MKKYREAWIVDDDWVYVFGMKKLMKHVGFCDNISTFTNGYEALNQLSLINKRNIGTLPDVILLDINMPVWDGWEFLNFAEDLNVMQDITLFIISSSIRDEDKQHAADHPMVSNYYVKPISIDELKGMMVLNKGEKSS